MNEVEIPLKVTGIGSMKAELRALKVEIANATDPEQMAALAQQAGVLSDKIKDANDAVNVFASGSKFEQVSNGLGGIKNSLMSLDFEEAAQKSQVFAKTLSTISQTDISTSFKGITSMVKTLGGAFIRLGMQILANPLFLLVAVIVGIVVAIGVFLNKIGVLGKVIDFVMYPLNLLIEGLKWLGDALGLTSFAAEENAERIEKANEKIIESSKQRTEAMGAMYDFEIEKAKINGADTTKLEIQKSKAITNEAKLRRDRQIMELKALNKIANEDNAEKRKKLRESIAAENKTILQGSRERILIQMRETKAKKEEYAKQREAAQKAAEDEAKAAADAAKEAAREAAQRYKERRDAIKKATEDIQKEIAAANKLVLDSNKTQQQKEKDDVVAKYAELIKTAEKYKQDTTALKAAQNVELAAIDKGYAEQEAEKQKKIDEEKLAREKLMADQLKAFKESEAQREEDIVETIYQLGRTAQQKEIEANQYHFDELIAQAERYGQDTTLLKAAQKEEEAKINKKFALQEIEEEKAKRDAKIQFAADVASGLGSIGDMFIKDQKKLEKFNKAQALVQIGIDTAKAISSLIATSQANPLNAVTGGAAGIAQYAAGVVQILANVAKAKALLSNPSGSVSGGGGGGTESSTSVSAATPSVQMFGQGNNLNSAGGTKSVNANQNMVVTAVVSESDITSTQNKLSKLQKSAEL